MERRSPESRSRRGAVPAERIARPELRRGRPRGDAALPGDDTVFDLVIQPDGKLVAAGWSSPGGFDIAMARYNADGSLDSSFDGDGMVIAPFRPASTYASHIVVQPDGKILTGGTGLARFNPDGGVDRSFGAGGGR